LALLQVYEAQAVLYKYNTESDTLFFMGMGIVEILDEFGNVSEILKLGTATSNQSEGITQLSIAK
jgi:hypothetical protein